MSAARTSIAAPALPAESRQGLVLALSGGGAAGLAHIGVLQVLAENDVPVRAVVGTSIGAEIGAFYVAGNSLDVLENVATRFDWKQTLALFMPDLPTGGLVSGTRIVEFLREQLGNRSIEDLPCGYAAVAVDLDTGEQVIIDRGDLVNAVRASVSLPGLIAPFRLDGRTLVDGGVLNPVPFDVARRKFGGPVVAVAVHGAVRDRTLQATAPTKRRQWFGRAQQLLEQPWIARAPGLRDWLRTQLRTVQAHPNKCNDWTTRRVLDRVLNIAQSELVRLRAEQLPPDLLVQPEVNRIGVIEFYRAKEAIAAGRRAAEDSLDDIVQLLRVSG